jgi:hypothetical protein
VSTEQICLMGAASQYPSRMLPQPVCGNLWGITTYFNPAGYANKIIHLREFAAAVRKQGLKLLIVEATFGSNDFVVDTDLADMIIRVRASAVLWLKERLINIGVQSLPPQCNMVAWLDGDIFFENPNWISETIKQLRTYAVVQPYSTAFWLNRGVRHDRDMFTLEDTYFTRPSTAYSEILNGSPDVLSGHMGFAWAARREILSQCGLYDSFILGGGDYVAAAAMYGLSAQGYLNMVCTPIQVNHVSEWMQRFHTLVRGSVSYVEGSLFHLWHGDRSNRRYVTRFQILAESEFDPSIDINLDPNGCWQWSTKKEFLQQEVYNYFFSRQEE